MKRRLLSCILILCMLAMPVSAADTGTAAAYLALGDDLSLETDASASFPEILAGDRGWTLENRARAGQTCAQLLDALRHDEALFQSVTNADIITITIGTNDLLSAMRTAVGRACQSAATPQDIAQMQHVAARWLLFWADDASGILGGLIDLCSSLTSPEINDLFESTLEDFSKSWTEVIALVRAANDHARIVVCAGYNPYAILEEFSSNGVTAGDISAYWVEQLADIIRDCAEDALCLTADFSDVQSNAVAYLNVLLGGEDIDEERLSTLINLDPTPTAAGIQTMATNVLRAIKLEDLQQLSRPDEAAVLPFSDVTDEAYDAVLRVYAAGLMEGVSETLFCPDETLTRAMAVTILYRLEGCPETGDTAPFSDIDSEKWYAQAVGWAAECGIAQGSNGIFGPGEMVTVQELAAFLYRYADMCRIDVVYSEENLEQAQVLVQLHTLDDWALEYVAWALSLDMMDLDVLRPTEPATRADAARFLSALLDRLPSE